MPQRKPGDPLSDASKGRNSTALEPPGSWSHSCYSTRANAGGSRHHSTNNGTSNPTKSTTRKTATPPCTCDGTGHPTTAKSQTSSHLRGTPAGTHSHASHAHPRNGTNHGHGAKVSQRRTETRSCDGTRCPSQRSAQLHAHDATART